jgi:hypothetical protein
MSKIDERFLFSPCFEIVAWRYRSYKSKVYDKVFGIIYRYSQFNDGICYASARETLAPAIGISPKVFGETVEVLKRDGLITELEEGKRHTGQYIPNMDKLEELLKEKEQGKVYVNNAEENPSLNKTKGIPKSIERRKYPLRGEVENTSVLREIIPQSAVDNTDKEKESLREILIEGKEKSELSEGSTPSSVPPDEGETLVSPLSQIQDSSLKEAIEKYEDFLNRKTLKYSAS